MLSHAVTHFKQHHKNIQSTTNVFVVYSKNCHVLNSYIEPANSSVSGSFDKFIVILCIFDFIRKMLQFSTYIKKKFKLSKVHTDTENTQQ